MSARCHAGEYLGLPAVFLENERLQAAILPGRGARLIRFRDSFFRITVLNEPSSVAELDLRPFEFGVPVLFPPNRIRDGMFRFGGREYRFPVNEPGTRCHIHGFLHDAPWDIVDEGIDDLGLPFARLRHAWHSGRGGFASYPHPCSFTLTFRLEADAIRQTVAIMNRGSEPMPLCFGYHTAFSTPRDVNHRIRFPAREKWLLDGRFCSAGSLADAGGEGNVELRYDTGRVFGHYRLAPRDSGTEGPHGVELLRERDGVLVRYEFDAPFRNLVVWNKQGEDGFLCLEPQTCAIDAMNLDMPYPETGVVVLDGHGEFHAATRLSVSGPGAGENPDSKGVRVW